MARTRQQGAFEAFVTHNQQLNRQQPVASEAVDQSWRSTNVEQNVDIMKVTIEKIDAMMLQMAQ